jgi:O-antigen/teichoic acid export membrane protein
VTVRTATVRALREGAAIAVGMAIMNLTTYGFTILAARLLGPAEYGALAAVMGLLLVVNVLSLGLQATGARRVSAAPHDLEHIEAEVLRASYRSALALGGITLLASPVIAILLHLDTWLIPVLVAVTAVPLSVMGGQAGIFQGERRWGSLALIYVSVGVARMGFGLLALLIEPNTLSAMVGVAIGAMVPTVVGGYALRHPSRLRDRPAAVATVPEPRPTPWGPGGVLREVGHNSHALLAFFALSNIDVVTARITLDEHQAGLYAGGLIMAKAVLFLPQFVVVLAFPSMASNHARAATRVKSLALVLCLGLVTILGVYALSGIAVEFVGGGQYDAISGMLWAFAGLGTLLALLQVLVYDVVARQHRKAVFLVWAALVAVLCTIPFVATAREWLVVVTTTDSTLLVVLFVLTLRHSRVVEEPVAEDSRRR